MSANFFFYMDHSDLVCERIVNAVVHTLFQRFKCLQNFVQKEGDGLQDKESSKKDAHTSHIAKAQCALFEIENETMNHSLIWSIQEGLQAEEWFYNPCPPNDLGLANVSVIYEVCSSSPESLFETACFSQG